MVVRGHMKNGQVLLDEPVRAPGKNAGISAAELAETYNLIDTEIRNSFDVIELTEGVVSQAAVLSRTHAMRAADAIQLSCALAAVEELPDVELRFVSSDLTLNTVAASEGLQVVDPTTL